MKISTMFTIFTLKLHFGINFEYIFKKTLTEQTPSNPQKKKKKITVADNYRRRLK